MWILSHFSLPRELAWIFSLVGLSTVASPCAWTFGVLPPTLFVSVIPDCSSLWIPIGLLWLCHDRHNATCAWSLGFRSLDVPFLVQFFNSAAHFVSQAGDLISQVHVCLFRFMVFQLVGSMWCNSSCDCECQFRSHSSTFCALRSLSHSSRKKNRRSFVLLIRFSQLLIVGSHVYQFTCCMFTLSKLFDSTLGFPGEGPNVKKQMSIVTSNIGSLKTCDNWKTLDYTAMCIQETRIGKNNVRSSCCDVQALRMQLFHGKLLPGLLQTNGHVRTAHGGTAVIAPAAITAPLLSSQDATGLYQKIFDTHRCNAVWLQVTRNIRALVFSFYGHTGASSDHAAFEANEALLADLFIIAQQFGDIPVIIAGDFQSEPVQYESIANATNFWGWTDPLVDVQADGCVRPLTYSLDKTFSGYGDKTSSIDGIILNKVATCALVKIEVLEMYNTQHRPIKAVFEWDTIVQEGFIHVKTAPLDLSSYKTLDSQTLQKDDAPDLHSLWVERFHRDFEHANVETKWQLLNDYCVQSLLQRGAKWAKGIQERGTPPRFQKKQICPGQLPSGAIKSHFLQIAYKTLNRLNELFARLQRHVTTPADWHITRCTIRKTWLSLRVLKAQGVWHESSTPNLVQIKQCQDEVRAVIQDAESKRKNARITRWKEKIKCSSQSNYAFVFHHLKHKSLNEPPNLVTKADGAIVYQPQQALRTINEQWDDIFSANIVHEDPMKVVQMLWPYIKHDWIEAKLPLITAQDLFDVIQNRKHYAAPGLDGWRTAELQCLPAKTFEPIAAFFNAMEASDEGLPKILTCAKQMILNKNGSSEPLQKRLITVLPALLLAYTGSRYIHLQGWQQRLMPIQIMGGIRSRNMTSIATELRMDMDIAHIDHDAVIGVKLDKSKCFDRVVPAHVAALFLAFGIDKGMVNMFIKLYQGLHRHLFYKNWASRESTTITNGVAQGCSLSLVAINVYSKVWTCLLRHLPEITAKAFVDDAYIWTRFQNQDVLAKALQVTEIWDLLVGQQLNKEKSTMWGTTQPARAAMKKLFPKTTLKLEFDILGTTIYTSQRDVFAFPVDKAAKIIGDIKNIAALPIPRHDKTHLIGMKILPQCTFTSGISCIPKLTVHKIQAEIVNTLWQNRTPWRSKWLVLTFLGQPHRIEPTYTRAYTALLDFLRYYHTHPQCKQMCVRLLNTENPPKFGLLTKLREMCKLFDLNLHPDLTMSWKGSDKIPLDELTPKDIKKCLQQFIKNACYQNAAFAKRKDIEKPTGVLDYDLSMLFTKHSKLTTNTPFPPVALFENQQVGASATRDRLCAANLTDDSTCRFCLNCKESINHLVECPHLIATLGFVPDHELGPNFKNFGVVEHPVKIAEHRLRWSPLPEVATIDHVQDSNILQIWTDGSVVWNENFWLTTASFAAVDSQGHCLAKGEVKHWSLSSYAAELWAIVYVVARFPQKLEIYSDCQTVVKQFHQMVSTRSVDPLWSHQSWWWFLLNIWVDRSKIIEDPIVLQWIPAHCFEEVSKWRRNTSSDAIPYG